MHSIHNEGKSVIVVRLVRTIKGKLYKNVITDNSKSYLAYLNRFVDQYNNKHHHSINKQSASADYSALTEKIETNLKAPKIKFNDGVTITKY